VKERIVAVDTTTATVEAKINHSGRWDRRGGTRPLPAGVAMIARRVTMLVGVDPMTVAGARCPRQGGAMTVAGVAMTAQQGSR
jgi:hypothetical protein